MQADSSLGSSLLARGWTQGALFTAPHVSFFYNDLSYESGDQPGYPGIRKARKDESFVVVSQLCDIVAPTQDEPYVEALLCKRATNQKFLAAIDRNSARYFVIDPPTGLVAQARYRVSLSKNSLSGLSPHPWPGNARRLDRFVRWLARRYDRPALPDELVHAFQIPVEKALSAFSDEEPALSALLSATVYELRVSLPPTEHPPFALHLVLMSHEESITRHQQVAIDSAVARIRSVLDPSLVHLDREILLSTDAQMSVAEHLATRPLFLEYLTYQGDEVVGTEPPPRV